MFHFSAFMLSKFGWLLLQTMPKEKAEDIDDGPSYQMDAAIVFHMPLVTKLASPSVRIPANYVGVRRVRPSNQIRDLEAYKKGTEEKASIIYKVMDENGNLRRMTKKEKRDLKQKIAMEKKEATEQKRLEAMNNPNKDESERKRKKTNNENKYHQLEINNSALKQELAELRGDRNGLPPVLLSPAMALQAQSVLLGTDVSTKLNGIQKGRCKLVYDHNLSLTWAKVIKEAMGPAEKVRKEESLRPMPYQLTPEPWKRMRPNLDEKVLETTERNDSLLTSTKQENEIPPAKCQWANITCRPPTSLDSDASIVFEYLHRETPFHVSCGAKFGSDFLLYDGPREERHAFAGLRILQSSGPAASVDTIEKDKQLPIPNAYSLSGYVRCLNTAGKFALLATVIREISTEQNMPLYRVAFVDIALEKVLTAPTHKRRRRTQLRRDVTLNLAKGK